VHVHELGRDELLLDRDIWVFEGSAGEAFEGADGVFEVGDFLCFRGLAEIAALGSEADDSSRGWMLA
jgi:hypothetical protein